MGDVNDQFRGKKGAFDDAVNGIKNSKKAGLKISLRMTLTKHNVNNLDKRYELFGFDLQEWFDTGTSIYYKKIWDWE